MPPDVVSLEHDAGNADVPGAPGGFRRAGLMTRTRTPARTRRRESPAASKSGTCRRWTRSSRRPRASAPISSANPVQFWVTEFGWSSKPPSKNGTPHVARDALGARGALIQIWKSGATVGAWFLLEDEPLSSPVPERSLSPFGLRSPTRQRSRCSTAFRFPFVAYIKSGGKVAIWGRDATSDKQDVTIQMRYGRRDRGRPLETITSNDYGIFQALPVPPTRRTRTGCARSGNRLGTSTAVRATAAVQREPPRQPVPAQRRPPCAGSSSSDLRRCRRHFRDGGHRPDGVAHALLR